MRRLACCLALLATTFAVHGACVDDFEGACLEHQHFTWESVAAPRDDHGLGAAALAFADGAIVIGGDGSAKSVEYFEDGMWVRLPGLNVRRAHHRAVVLRDGRLLVVGGDGDALFQPATAEIYDRATGRWTMTAPLRIDRHVWLDDLTATLLDDGRVLVTGGSHGTRFSALREAEIFDPANGTWELTGAMAHGRVAHSATRMADGRVLVVGGYSDWDMPFHMHSAEIYDPAAGRWTTLAGPGIASHVAALLPDGRVLVAGGRHAGATTGLTVAASRPNTGRSWLFIPADGTWHLASRLALEREDHLPIPLPNAGWSDDPARWNAFAVLAHPRAPAEVYDYPTARWLPMPQAGDPPSLPLAAVKLQPGATLVIEPNRAAIVRLERIAQPK